MRERNINRDNNVRGNNLKRDRNRKKKKSKLKIFLGFIVVVLITVLGAGAYFYNMLGKMSVNSSETSNESTSLLTLPGKPTEASNILILGADYVPGENTDFTERRTDTMMVAHYDNEQNKLVSVSLPRDTRVKVNEKIQKLNAVNVIGGPELVIETVKEVTGIEIDNYVIVDYTGFNKIIDAIGGVDVTVPQRMKYDDPGQDYHIDYKKGDQVHLDGKAAETFFRWRHNNAGMETDTIDGGGDLGRIENQKVLIRAVVEKVASPTIITKISSLINSITESVVTDMTPSDMLKFGYAVATMGNDNIEFSTLKGQSEYIGGISYYIYSGKENIDLVNTMNNNDPYVDRSDYKVKIVNASGRTIAATTIEQYLVKNTTYTASNIDTEKVKTTIASSYVEVYDKDAKYNDLILKDFSKFNIKKVTSVQGKEDYDVIVYVGKDYK